MNGIKWEGLIFGGAAIGWGIWELWSLRRANRRAALNKRQGQGAALDPLGPAATDPD